MRGFAPNSLTLSRDPEWYPSRRGMNTAAGRQTLSEVQPMLYTVAIDGVVEHGEPTRRVWDPGTSWEAGWEASWEAS